MSNQRYTALLLASLEPVERQRQLNALPNAQRSHLRELIAKIGALFGGTGGNDHRAIAALLAELPPPMQPRTSALDAWLASAPILWASAIFRSVALSEEAGAALINSGQHGREACAQHWCERFPAALGQAVLALASEDAAAKNALAELAAATLRLT
jgi:hypothetical protein